jgi:hypothetical protein
MCVQNISRYLHESCLTATVELRSGVLILLKCSSGRAIAQAVSQRLTIAAARVRSQGRSCGTCGGQSSIGAGFPC